MKRIACAHLILGGQRLFNFGRHWDLLVPSCGITSSELRENVGLCEI